MDALLQNFANVDTLIKVYPLLLQGVLVTVKLVLVCVPLGIVAGLLIAMVHSLHLRGVNWVLVLYVDFMRAFPPLVLLILIYYGLPFIGLELGEFGAAVLALVLNSSGYYGEILRAGIESVPGGQAEAARSTGLNAVQALVYVVVPQALKNVVPPLTTNTLEVVKITAVASAVALPELLRSARIAQGLVYNPTPLMAAALIYLVCLWPFVRLASRFERRMMTLR